MSKRSVRTVLFALGLLCIAHGASAESNAGASPPVCDPKTQPVDVEPVDTGWLVTRTGCPGESSPSMAYSFGDVKGNVSGQKSGDAWTFAITEKVPADAFVSLEFSVFVGVSDPKAAHDQLLAFAQSVQDAVHESFDAAELKTRGLTDGRWDVLLSLFTAEARKRVSSLTRQSNLGDFYTEGAPAVEAILRKAHFQKIASADPQHPENADWEPTPEALDDLKKFKSPAAQELESAHDQIKNYSASPEQPPACLGQPKSAFASGGTAPQREAALKACFNQLLSSAQTAKVAAADADVTALSGVDQSKGMVAALVNFPVLEGAPAPNVDKQLIKVQDPIDRLLAKINKAKIDAEQGSKAAKPADKKAADLVVTSSTGALNDYIAAEAALDFVAALEIEQVLTIDAWNQKLNNEFVPDPAALVSQLTFARQAMASQLLKVKPGKPRFFVSTGVAVTSLNDTPGKSPNKLSIPVLVSICWSHSGCESKGLGSGGSALNYLSTDLGVNTVFLGDKNPRQGTPSFLFGLGATPIYATHVSFGVNVFENPQKKQVNVAGYVALTLDVVDGAGILGALGIGKPTPEVIGGAPASD